MAAGFTLDTKDDGNEYFVLTPSADAWPRLTGAMEEVGRVMAESNRGMAAGGVAPPAAAAGSGSLPGGLPNFFPPGGTAGVPGIDMTGSMTPAMQAMLSDPNTMASMLNNPMVQNMMRNDSRLANNPMLQQSLSALQNNPEMMTQFSQMMSDPTVRDRMANLMQQQQQPGGAGSAADPFGAGPEAMRRQMEQFQRMSQQFGGTSGGFNAGGGGAGGSGTVPAPAPGSGAASNGNNASGGGGGGGGNDNEMTEEDMIAEAIRRSMQEQ